MTHKTCTRCKETKPLSEFTRAKFGKDGLNTRCRPCIADARTESVMKLRESGEWASHCAVASCGRKIGPTDPETGRKWEGKDTCSKSCASTKKSERAKARGGRAAHPSASKAVKRGFASDTKILKAGYRAKGMPEEDPRMWI